jgi:pimeloyl-ACP methyl ester carboxylesterase
MSSPMPHVEGVTHRTVNVGGLGIHVAETGGGPPLVLLHGWPQHWYMWRHVMPTLATSYRVIAPDLRGLGWSDAPHDGYDKEQLATDLLRLLDTLGLDRIRLAGHDWGGIVGFLTCLRAPERVERFLALNIIHPWVRLRRFAPQAWRSWYIAVLSSPVLGSRLLRHRPEFVRTMLRLGVVNRATFTPEEVEAFVAPLREPARARASARLYRTFVLRELIPATVGGRYRGARLETPTRLVFGEADAFIWPGLLDGYAAHTDDCAVELVPGCGHFIVEERPDVVVDRIRAFLA